MNKTILEFKKKKDYSQENASLEKARWKNFLVEKELNEWKGTKRKDKKNEWLKEKMKKGGRKLKDSRWRKRNKEREEEKDKRKEIEAELTRNRQKRGINTQKFC